MAVAAAAEKKKKRKKSLSAYQRNDGTFDILSLVKDANDGLKNQIINTLDRIEGKTKGGCSTGLLTLDYYLNGGLPKQRLNYYYGPQQSGKSTNMYFAVREAQRQGRIVLFMDAEQSLDPDYLSQLGVNLESPTTVFMQPLVGEDAMLVLKRVLKKFADDNYYFPDDQTPLVIFDSLAALVPEGIYEEKESRAMLARLLSDNLKALNALIQYINGTTIAVNQIRSSAGAPFMPFETEPGGFAVKFYPSTKIKINATDPFTYPDGVPGHYAKFTLKKTRHCAYFDPQLIALRTGEGFNQMDDLKKMMDASGFLHRPTNQSYELNNGFFRKYFPTHKLPSKLKMRNADMDQYLYDHFEELYLGMRWVINEGSIFGERTAEQESLLERLERAEKEQIEMAEELAKAHDLPTIQEGIALMNSQGTESLSRELQRMEAGNTSFADVSAATQFKKADPEPEQLAPKPVAKKKTKKAAVKKKAEPAAAKPKPEPTPAKVVVEKPKPVEQPAPVKKAVPKPKLKPTPKPPTPPKPSTSGVYTNALTELEDMDAFEF